MDRLWERMTAIYGHRWTSAYGNEDDGTWLQGLAGVTPDQIAAGLSRCLERGDGWPPTLPEFRALCQEGAHNLPPVDRAYREACEHSTRPAEHDWSHPAVFVAGQDAGWWSLRRDPSRTTWPVFRRSYEDACNRVKAGEDLSALVVKSLPETPAEVKPADQETAKGHVSALRAQLRRPNNDCHQEDGEALA